MLADKIRAGGLRAKGDMTGLPGGWRSVHAVRCRRSTVRDYGFELIASPRTLSASSLTVPWIIRQTNPCRSRGYVDAWPARVWSIGT